MQHVGTRNEPSIRSLLIIVLIFVVVGFYLISALGTGDWLWFSSRFDHTPQAMMVHCYGETVAIDTGSYHFGAITKLVNEGLSGQKRWDPLTMSRVTYEEYRTSPNVVAMEVFYREPVRIHSSYRFYSSVDNLVIPLEGRYAQNNVVFGQNQDAPAAGSLQIESNRPLKEYLANQKICPVPLNGN
jgi:hypothetical protein